MSNIRFIYRGKVSVAVMSDGKWVRVAFARLNKGEQHVKADVREILEQRLSKGGNFVYPESEGALSVAAVLTRIGAYIRDMQGIGRKNGSELQDLQEFIDSFDYNIDPHGISVFYMTVKPQHGGKIATDTLADFGYSEPEPDLQDVEAAVVKEAEYPYMIGEHRVRFLHDSNRAVSVGFYQTKNEIRYTVAACSKADAKYFSKEVSRRLIMNRLLTHNGFVTIYKHRDDEPIMSYGEVFEFINESFENVNYHHPAFGCFPETTKESIERALNEKVWGY